MTRSHLGLRVALAIGLSGVLLSLWPLAAAQAQGPASAACFFSGQNVTIESGRKTCRSLNVLGGDVHIMSGAELDGALKVAGDVTVDGLVTGDVWVAGDLVVSRGGKLDGDASVTGDADVAGTVTGDLKVIGNADIAESATVNAVSAGGDVRRAEGAQVVDTARSGQRAGNPISLLLLALFTLLSAGFAALMAMIAGSALDRTRVAASRSPLLALVVGVLAWAVTVLLLVPLAFTIIGPVIWLTALVVGIALGWAAFSDGFGRRLWSSGNRPLAAALGGALLALLVMFLLVGGGWLSRVGTGAAGGPIICLGLALVLGLWTWGLGASLLTLYGSRPYPRAAAVSAGALPAGEAVPLPAPAADNAALVVAAAAVAGSTETDSETATAVVATDAAESADSAAVPVVAAAAAAAALEHEHAESDDAAEAMGDTSVAADAAVVGAAAAAVAASEHDEAESEDAPAADGDTSLAGEAALAGAVAAADGDSEDEPSPAAEAAAISESPDEDALGGAAADVRSLPGISPIFGFLLAEGGIKTVADLAAASPEEVRTALSVPGVVPVDDDTVAAWQAAARQQAAGGA
jgi:cytoskeletal protein CcmA (bactofilin family)